MMKELKTIELLNESYNLGLIPSSDRYSSYDAEGGEYIVEIKNRRKYYSEKIIEASKMFVNYQKSQLKGKDFLYVVSDNRAVWIFNISKYIEDVVHSGVRVMLQPAQTDFGNNKKIRKYCFLLDESIASKHNYKTNLNTL